MAPIIEVRNIGKQYRLAGSLHRHDNLREWLVRGVRSTLGRLRLSRERPPSRNEETFWALRDIDFDVEAGDVVGIIGRNGAGKSTLLKILSRITDPTEGTILMRGRLASLLEVGTGFHPELTGRENIYLNGAILGMRKEEIDARFDEIIAFSEIERFLDTPVKHYSSGMYVRLAFSVAAHLNPEILIVDEVLAVGDMAFQKKCLGKMGEVSKSGRTVIFVSHNLAAVENLCRSCIVLANGRISFQGSSKDAVARLVRDVFGESVATGCHIIDLTNSQNRRPKLAPIMERMELYSDGHKVIGGLAYGDPLTVQLAFRLKNPADNYDVLVSFNNLLGDPIFVAHSRFEPHCPVESNTDEQVFACDIPSLTLVPGEYMINVAIVRGNALVDCIEHVTQLTVTTVDFYGTGRVPRYGTTVLPHRWRRISGHEAVSVAANHGADRKREFEV